MLPREKRVQRPPRSIIGRHSPAAHKPAAATPGSRVAVTQLLALVDESYILKAWHGPNLRGSIRGLDAAVAGWRPSAGRHSIAEIVVHCAYWKYTVRRRLLNERKGSVPLKGSNWFPRPERLSAAAWKGDLELLGAMHDLLREAVAALTDRDLEHRPAGSKVTRGVILRGIASHDVYHAGQIQLLKRLMQ